MPQRQEDARPQQQLQLSSSVRPLKLVSGLRQTAALAENTLRCSLLALEGWKGLCISIFINFGLHFKFKLLHPACVPKSPAGPMPGPCLGVSIMPQSRHAKPSVFRILTAGLQDPSIISFSIDHLAGLSDCQVIPHFYFIGLPVTVRVKRPRHRRSSSHLDFHHPRKLLFPAQPTTSNLPGYRQHLSYPQTQILFHLQLILRL